MTAPGKPTCLSDLLDALQAAIAASDAERREAVGAAIDAYAMHFPEGFRWASGPQSPTLLHCLLSTIDLACRPASRSRACQPQYLIDRKSYPQPHPKAGAFAHCPQEAISETLECE